MVICYSSNRKFMPITVSKVKSCFNKYQKLEMALELGRGWKNFEVMIRLA